MKTFDDYAYVIISAHGTGSYDLEESKRHNEVWETIPENVREVLVKTDDIDVDEVEDEMEVETKWCGFLNADEWHEFQEAWSIEANHTDNTMGMITELGHMWALCESSHGTDWNSGGVMPVSYVDVYFNCLDRDILERAGVDLMEE